MLNMEERTIKHNLSKCRVYKCLLFSDGEVAVQVQIGWRVERS